MCLIISQSIQFKHTTLFKQNSSYSKHSVKTIRQYEERKQHWHTWWSEHKSISYNSSEISEQVQTISSECVQRKLSIKMNSWHDQTVKSILSKLN